MSLSVLWSYSYPLPPNYFDFQVEVCDEATLVLDNVARRIVCLESETGAQRWVHRRVYAERANTVKGATEGVLVLAEYRGNDGPWGADFGVYRYDLQTGEFLGASHGEGGGGRFLHWLDWVPDFTNELRQTSVAVCNGKITTDAGRVLDARSGEVVGAVTREKIAEIRLQVARPEHQLTVSDKQVAL